MNKKIKNIIKKPKAKLSKLIKLIKFYYLYLNKISFKKSNNNRKEIIIIFDGNFPHGGLVDRLKGIVSFYQVAKKVDADFKIYFKSPFELTHFLIPNEYNWMATDNDLNWNPFSTKALYVMLNFTFDPIKYISKSKKKKFFVFCNIDYSKINNPSLTIEQQENNWKDCFNELFKKSDYLNNEFKNLYIKPNSIAIHTRFTTLFGDFKDSTKRLATEERKTEIKNLLLNSIKEIETLNPNKSIYVFSDSVHFLNFIKTNTNYIVLDGNPHHIDEDKKGENLQNHLKTFLDFYTISECEQVYLLQTNGMSGSGFSKYAAIVGGNQFYYKKV